jgi:hypothetical protein
MLPACTRRRKEVYQYLLMMLKDSPYKMFYKASDQDTTTSYKEELLARRTMKQYKFTIKTLKDYQYIMLTIKESTIPSLTTNP